MIKVPENTGELRDLLVESPAKPLEGRNGKAFEAYMAARRSLASALYSKTAFVGDGKDDPLTASRWEEPVPESASPYLPAFLSYLNGEGEGHTGTTEKNSALSRAQLPVVVATTMNRLGERFESALVGAGV
jgi:hypothetical protein